MAVSAVRSAGLGVGGQGYRLNMMPASGGCCAGEFFLFFPVFKTKSAEKISLEDAVLWGMWALEWETWAHLWGTWAVNMGNVGTRGWETWAQGVRWSAVGSTPTDVLRGIGR